MVASAFLDLLAFWTRRKSIEVPIQILWSPDERPPPASVEIDDAHETTKSSVVLNP